MNGDELALIARFRRARGDPQRVVLEGFHPLKHALRFGAAIEVACAPKAEPVLALAQQLAPDLHGWLERHLVVLPPALFVQLAPVPQPSSVLALARRPAVDPEGVLATTFAAPIVLLEHPSHLGNLGAAVRVAAAAAAAAVLTIGRLDPWHPAALRGSAGLHYALPVARIDGLPEVGRTLLAIDPKGEPLEPGGIPSASILAFGGERQGLSPELGARAERRLALPMRSGVSSLNLAVAVGLALYAWRWSRPLP